MAVNRSKSDGFMLRLPEGLREAVKGAAEANNRSMNSEIVSRLEGIVPTDADGMVRVWLPEDLRERLEAAARNGQTKPEILIREAVEEAYPYTPTLADYIQGLRTSIDAAKGDANTALALFVEGTEKLLQDNPDLGEQPLTVPDRGWEMEPGR